MKVVSVGPKDVIWRGAVVPPSVRDLGMLMYAVAEDHRSTSDAFIPALAAFLDPKMKAEANAFLTHALDGRFTAAELKGLLNQIAQGMRFASAKRAEEFLRALNTELSKDA